MKKLVLKFAAVIFVSGLFATPSSAINPKINTKVIIDNTENWVMVQNENGIKVYFLNYTLNGDSYLKVKFENSTDKPVNFNWTVKNDNEVVASDIINGLMSNSSTETIHSAHLVLIKKGKSLNDFSINITIK